MDPTDNSIWTENNSKTLRTWKTSLHKAQFIYQYILQNYNKSLTRLMICSLIATSLSTLLSGISTIALSVDNDKPEYKLTALIINAILIFLGCVGTIITGIIKIYKLNENITEVTSYLTKLDHLYSEIANQLNIPIEMRENAATYIGKISKIYLELIQKSPIISVDQEKEAILLYNESMQEMEKHFRLSNDDTVIDVI